MVPLHATQIARREAAGMFPRRIRIGQARVAWSFEVLRWLEERRAERDAAVVASQLSSRWREAAVKRSARQAEPHDICWHW